MNTDPKRIGFVVSVFLGVLPWLMPSVGRAADPPASSVLHLTNGGFVPGELRASEDSKVLRWNSAFFARPFEFPLSGVTTVQYAVPAPLPRPLGEFCFELVDDDVLYGNLLGLTEDDLDVDTARIGRVRLRRE